MSLYGDAIKALRQVILLDERVRNTAIDVAAISREVADLRDRLSRIEGMLAVVMASSRLTSSQSERPLLSGSPDTEAGSKPGGGRSSARRRQ